METPRELFPAALPDHKGVLIESLWWGFRAGIRGAFLTALCFGSKAPWTVVPVGGIAVGLLAAWESKSLKSAAWGTCEGLLGGMAAWALGEVLVPWPNEGLVRGFWSGVVGFGLIGIAVGLLFGLILGRRLRHGLLQRSEEQAAQQPEQLKGDG